MQTRSVCLKQKQVQAEWLCMVLSSMMINTCRATMAGQFWHMSVAVFSARQHNNARVRHCWSHGMATLQTLH
jgi:hypothetical protein